MSMRLDQLLTGADVHPPAGSSDLRVSSLCYDSRQVRPGALFFALVGQHADGAKFAQDAIAGGAVAVVSETALDGVAVPVARVPDARAAMAEVARVFYDTPASGMRTFGVTGTNGKTTTAFLLRHLCDALQLRCGLVGTVKTVIGDAEFPAVRTTPESPDMQHLLAQMRDAGCRSVAVEVSSHAVALKRTRAVDWDAGIFTNLTQDHLDFHKTMDAYFDAKARLFEEILGQKRKRGRCIINSDDRYGRRLIERLPKHANPVTYGFGVGATYRVIGTKSDVHGTQFQLETRGRQYLVRSPLIGRFNVYNAVAAIAAVGCLGYEVRQAVQAMADAPQVPGRLERVPGRRNFQVFVDYAHTDDALSNVLTAVRDLRPRRIVTVFGCGGDRDRAKRPLMGKVAASLSDYSIVTSDNPRSEDPDRILADIVVGMKGGAFEVEPDRSAAIWRAVNLAEAGDIVLIAGKGHENYQEIQGVKRPFDDVSVARNAIDKKPVELED